jgi:hypothetical protein
MIEQTEDSEAMAVATNKVMTQSIPTECRPEPALQAVSQICLAFRPRPAVPADSVAPSQVK